MGDLLLAAADRGDAHAVIRLLSEGCKPFDDELIRFTALDYDWPVVKLTRALTRVVPDRTDSFRVGFPVMSCISCRVEDITYDVKHDCPPDCFCGAGRNGLHVAAAAGHANIVAALLLAKWDPNIPDKQGSMPLQRAAAGGHLDVVKLLIQHGAQINAQDKAHGNTALHEASWRGWSKCVEALSRAKKVNLDLKNHGGFAALHLACQNGHNQSCRELLLAEADPDVRNNYGDTPLHTSARYGHAGVTRILISAECKVSEQNKNGDTALHITAAMGRRKLTRILLEAGCNANLRNKQGERAKDIAIRKDLNEIIEIMEKTVAVRRKREKGSGSSKDSSGRKEKKKSKKAHHREGKSGEPWSPYGCHYFPDPQTFPQPRLDSLPAEPLRSGEQYFLDLAGNIKKGPVGIGYTCYCAPFFQHMEARLERDKRELKAHIDAAQGRLNRKVTSLEATTRGQLAELARGAALERAKCRQRHLHLEQCLLRGTVLKQSRLSRARSFESVLEPPKQQRSSSREGKESGKGSSEVVGPASDSEGEEKLRKSSRAMSERIDSVLRGSDGAEMMERVYGDLLQWRKHHRERKPSRESVQDIIAKFQKQQSVQQLVAKIQRKTDKIHKSAQKWKERHASKQGDSESSDEEEPLDPALERLPFRCRDTVYSPDPVYSSKNYSPDHVLGSFRMSDPLTNNNQLRIGSHEALHSLRNRAPVHFASAHDLLRTQSPSESAHSPQADSGYSTKPWAPSPSPPAVSSGDLGKPPVPVRKSIRPATASLV